MLSRFAIMLTLTVVFRFGMLVGLLTGPGLAAVVIFINGTVFFGVMLIAPHVADGYTNRQDVLPQFVNNHNKGYASKYRKRKPVELTVYNHWLSN